MQHVVLRLDMAPLGREDCRDPLHHLDSHDPWEGKLEGITLGQLHDIGLCAICVLNVGQLGGKGHGVSVQPLQEPTSHTKRHSLQWRLGQGLCLALSIGMMKKLAYLASLHKKCEFAGPTAMLVDVQYC